MNISTYQSQTNTKRMSNPWLCLAGMVLVLLALFTPRIAKATDECIGTTTNGHGPSEPDTGDCVYMKVYTASDGRIIVQYWGNQDYDFYQLRWSRPGIPESQVKVPGSGARGGWWALNNAWTNTPYTFKVQACYSSILGSDCTYWQTESFTKASVAQNPATCKSGYVWREAFPGDLTCVEPWVRDQAGKDNRLARTRVDPKAGYGPNGCKSGYVWRVARPSDLVCVTPATRDQTALDNRLGPNRVIGL